MVFPIEVIAVLAIIDNYNKINQGNTSGGSDLLITKETLKSICDKESDKTKYLTNNDSLKHISLREVSLLCNKLILSADLDAQIHHSASQGVFLNLTEKGRARLSIYHDFMVHNFVRKINIILEKSFVNIIALFAFIFSVILAVIHITNIH